MSEPATDGASVQFNLGGRSRIAGRDYYESRVPDSIRMYLATMPSERLDEEAIDNERLFYYRFALDLPRAARVQVVAIKQRYGLTDSECRWLRRSGQVRVTRDSAQLVRDRWVPAMGWFYAIILISFCGPNLLLIAVSGAPAWQQALGSSVLAAFWLGSLWFIDRMFLAPWRWLRAMRISPAGGTSQRDQPCCDTRAISASSSPTPGESPVL